MYLAHKSRKSLNFSQILNFINNAHVLAIRTSYRFGFLHLIDLNENIVCNGCMF